MSLRTRLVLVVLALLALGMGTAVGAIFGAVQDWTARNGEDMLAGAARELEPAVRDGRFTAPVAPRDDVTRVWQATSSRGNVPAYFATFEGDGSSIQVYAAAGRPPLGGTALPADLRPDGPDDTRSARRGSWLLRASALPEGRILVVGARADEADELVHRTRSVALVCLLAALLLTGLLAFRAVKSSLRPLERIAEAAGAIGGGDLTRRVETAGPRTEVGRLGAALNAMLGQLETAFRRREASEERLRRFLADASHELRTPVSAVRAYAELFRRGAADHPDDLARVMRRIESETARMGSLIEEMLALARLDEGRSRVREPVDLAALADDAVADASVLAPDRDFGRDGDGSVTVQGDPDQLRQVLGNLLANVVHHTPEGGPATVRVTRDPDGGEALIEVSDRGQGLTAEQRERVFERFYRADPSRSRENGGAGLGLSIVAAITTAHGGTVGVTSEPGVGTTFSIRLPAEM